VLAGFCWGNHRERDQLEGIDVGGRIILKCLFKRWGGGTDWSNLGQDRDRWQALVNAVMNFRVP